MATNATDLSLKDAAGTARTFTLLTPASGYGQIAEWAYKVGPIATVFPRLTAMARNVVNSQRARASGGRQVAHEKNVSIKLVVPSSYMDTVTGLTNVGSAMEFTSTVRIPADFPEDRKPDAVAFYKEAVGHALIQAMFKDGTPAS